jgi:hypothetical protein
MLYEDTPACIVADIWKQLLQFLNSEPQTHLIPALRRENPLRVDFRQHIPIAVQGPMAGTVCSAARCQP